MPKLYCHDCTHCDSDRTTCEHPKGIEFLAYMEWSVAGKVVPLLMRQTVQGLSK